MLNQPQIIPLQVIRELVSRPLGARLHRGLRVQGKGNSLCLEGRLRGRKLALYLGFHQP